MFSENIFFRGENVSKYFGQRVVIYNRGLLRILGAGGHLQYDFTKEFELFDHGRPKYFQTFSPRKKIYKKNIS